MTQALHIFPVFAVFPCVFTNLCVSCCSPPKMVSTLYQAAFNHAVFSVGNVLSALSFFLFLNTNSFLSL